MYANKMEYTCLKQNGAISIVNGQPVKCVNQFKYLDSNISATENNVNIRLAKAWNSIDKLSIIWKSN